MQERFFCINTVSMNIAFARRWLKSYAPNLFDFYIKTARAGVGWVFLFLLFSTALNYAFIWLSVNASYERSILTFELATFFALALLRLKGLAILCVLFSLLCEITLTLSSTLQLLTFLQVLNMSSFVFYINRSYLAYISLAFLLSAFAVFFIIYSAKRISFKKIPVIIVCSLSIWFIIYPDLYYMIKYNGISKAVSSLSAINYKKLFNESHEASLEYTDLQYSSAFELTLKNKLYSSSQRPDKVLYVTAESWGYPKDKKILDSQIKSLLANNEKIELLKADKIFADNSTIAAELRELCNKKSNYLSHIMMDEIKRLKIIGATDTKGMCWPEYLRDEGYTIVAMHGANGKMYDRKNLYKIFGFETSYFDGDMPINTRNRCKSWPGYCDADLMQVMQNDLLRHDKILFYWMTLNSHVPYEKSDINNFNQVVCESDLPNGYSEQLCNYHQLHLQFFKNLSLILNKPEFSGLHVVVVGDHKPKFMDGAHKVSSSDLFLENTVPYLYFIIR